MKPLDDDKDFKVVLEVLVHKTDTKVHIKYDNNGDIPENVLIHALRKFAESLETPEIKNDILLN